MDAYREHFDKFFEETSGLLCVCNFQGDFLHCNKAFAAALGYSADDFELLRYTDLVHPDDVGELEASLQYLRHSSSLSDVRLRLRSKDHSYRLFQSAAYSVPEHELIYVIVCDITNHEHAERAIRESNDMLKAVSEALLQFVNQTPDVNPFETMLSHMLKLTQSEYGFIGEVLQDENGQPYLKSHALTNIAWNDETRELYRANKKTGLQFTNLNSLFGHVMTSGQLVISNAPAVDPRRCGLPPGHPPMDAFMGVPIYSGQDLVGMVGLANKPSGYTEEFAENLGLLISVCSNLILAFRTEIRKREVEQQLIKSEKTVRALVDCAMDGIFTMDRDGRVLSVNPSMTSIFQCETSDITKGSVFDLFDRESATTLRDLMQSLDTLAKPHRGLKRELTGVTRDGSPFPLELSINSMSGTENDVYVAIVRDVTDWQSIREELTSAKLQAESANRAKGEFLANMSHEVRTPINGILGMTDLALQSNLDEEQRDYLETVKDSAKTLLSIVNDILDFSKIEAGKLVLDTRPFNLRQELAFAMRDMARRAADKGVRFNFTVSEDVPFWLLGDSLRLRQVMINLVSNAVKFTVEGEINVTISIHKQQDALTTLRFVVRDTGIGISDDQKATIFQAFSQGDASITRRYGGSGLGLVISSNLVKMMGGQLEFESVYGQGSTFVVFLDFAASAEAGPVVGDRIDDSHPIELVDATGPVNCSEKEILLVEDNPINTRLAQAILSRAGYRVVCVSTGQEAVSAATAKAFNLILMDLQMPEMDGQTATQIIHSWQRSRHKQLTPVVAVTAHAMVGDQQKCLDAGMVDYLSKPYAASQLLAMVAAHIS